MKKTSFKANEDTRIWCEYCRIFVYNNRINREKHDNSPQHQANFKKKVETIRREEEQQKRLQNDLVTKPSVNSKSFYSESKTSSNSQINQPSNILNLKSSSSTKSVEKKQILGLSSMKPVSNSKMSRLSSEEDPSETVETRTSSSIFDIKSTALDLKRKIKEDEKRVLEPKTVEPVTEEISLESLNVFKKKKSK